MSLRVLAGDASVLIVEPRDITLRSRHDNAQLILTAQLADGRFIDVTRGAKYSVSPPGAVKVANGRVLPNSDGRATLNVSASLAGDTNAFTASIPINVEGYKRDRRLNFANDIIPILSKTGCNAGGCHGKASGQNGFRLSLLGADPDADYEALVKQDRGRRMFPAAPDKSLLLAKGSAALAHGGGQRLKIASDEYEIVRRWIVQGMPKGSTNDPKIVAIEVSPPERVVATNSAQQLRVVARYSDGAVLDVTHRAQFKSQQADLLAVDDSGEVKTLAQTGEGTVMVRFMGQVAVARISIPFRRDPPAELYAPFKPLNFIDDLAWAKWRKLGIAPSEGSSDEQFIRRVFIDALGTLPARDEVIAFLEDGSTDKRTKLVERVLDRNEYADFWAYQWGDLLRNKRRYGDPYKRGTFAFASWIRNAFAQNMPYDQFVRAILTAQGNVSDNPPVAWYREVRNQIHQVNDTSQLFLGTRIACANCHNHPYERWTQDDYWGFAAFFARLGNKQGEIANETAVFVKKDGETRQPRSNKLMKPKGLGGAEYEYSRGEDPRLRLVDWMTSTNNPFFARAIANRIWAHYMGVGLVEAVDDLRVSNPPSNPELLDALANDLVDHHFDLKQLMCAIMNSRVYQLSSIPTEHNRTDRQNYARYYPKRLAAEVLLDAVDTVTGVQEKFPGFPAGTRAVELPDEAVESYFLDVFGRSQRESPCECERSYAPNLSQVLHLMNSPQIQNKLASDKGWLGGRLQSQASNEEVLKELYFRAIARGPRPEELSSAITVLAKAKDRKNTLEDLEWTLLNSKEFLFNH